MLANSILFTLFFASSAVLAASIPKGHEHSGSVNATAAPAPPNCFPAIGFKMPSSVPDISTIGNWWCDYSTEYAFVGFSYEVTACQSLSQLRREFLDIRNQFNGRYVRLYGACDRANFYDDIVDAAWGAGIGVHALVWFGFDGDNKWMTRRDNLFKSIKNNPKAPFVTRAVQFGSEPLFDWVLEPNDLATQVKNAKNTLKPYGIKLTVSEMAYGYQEHDGAQSVIDAVDFMDVHMLPFFAWTASTANKSWPIVQTDLQWFIDHSGGRKIYFSQNGWPSTTYSGVEPNSPDAVADIPNERDYANLLDAHCNDFKNVPGGGVGWFWHIYSDDQEPGYGLYNYDGKLKFPFKPRTSC